MQATRTTPDVPAETVTFDWLPARQVESVKIIVSQSTVDDETGCWICALPKMTSGYPVAPLMYGAGKGAHRVMCATVNGKDVDYVPRSTDTMHSCDNRACVNPDHLSFGTRTQNVRDMISKGRDNFVVPKAHAAKTHCSNGHRLAGKNIYEMRAQRDGHRVCVVCNRASSSVKNASRRGRYLSFEEAVAIELARTDRGRDEVARDALS